VYPNDLDEPSSGAIFMDLMPMTILLKIMPKIQNYLRGKIITMNYRSIATMASQVSFTFDVNDVFLINKMEIDHEKKNKIKISNLKPLALSL
jgi:hypothetical protein